MYHLILDAKAREDITNFNTIGPVPTFAVRARGRYSWQLFLRGSDPARILSRVALPQGWTIDIDPIGIV